MGEEKVVASNRKATHDYFIEERFETGLALRGSEMKSIRAGRVQLREAYVRVDVNNEVWLINAHISVYDPAASQNHEPLRPRKLLLHRKENVNLACDGIRQMKIRNRIAGCDLMEQRQF